MIDKFQKEYRWLSNFYASEIPTIYGIHAPTVEHYFQMSKAKRFVDAMEILCSKSPYDAKRLGRKVDMVENWEEVKLEVMEEALRLKFSIPEFKDKLIATGDQELIEGNDWGDTYWGVCNGVGDNHLGKLLMKIRKEIK